MMHLLKTLPEPFQAVWQGLKRYEIRVNDRDFVVGDKLLLVEYSNESHSYSGREIECVVNYMSEGAWGLPAGLCVMSIEITKKSHPFSDS